MDIYRKAGGRQPGGKEPAGKSNEGGKRKHGKTGWRHAGEEKARLARRPGPAFLQAGLFLMAACFSLSVFPSRAEARGETRSETQSEAQSETRSEAQSAEKREVLAVSEIHHFHTGGPQKQGGCYTEAVPHKHAGSAGECGGCYQTPIYHIHTGDREKGGGCYGGKVYHTHTGVPDRSGGCYRTPVFHRHGGSAAAWGGCYIKPVYHVHEGNPETGGSCYEPVFHVHTDSCFQDAVCTAVMTGDPAVLRTYKEYCYHHGDTQHAEIRGLYRHSDCGRGLVEDNHLMCWTCQNYNSTHAYRKTVCGKDEASQEGYRLRCTKGSADVERWETGCGKTESTVERYALSCAKTPESVEYYKRNCEKDEKSVDAYARSCQMEEGETERWETGCGKEEHLVCARLFLKEADGDRPVEKTWLYAVCEDKDGFLKGWNGAYRWTRDGQTLNGSEDRIEITENGCYTVALDLIREDLRQEELTLSLTVDNLRPAPSTDPQPDGTEPGREEPGKTEPGDGTQDGSKPGEGEGTPDPEPEGGEKEDEAGNKKEDGTGDKTEDEAGDKKDEGGRENSGGASDSGGSGGHGGKESNGADSGNKGKEEKTEREPVEETPERIGGIEKTKVQKGKSGLQARPAPTPENATKTALPLKNGGQKDEKDQKVYETKSEESPSPTVAAGPPDPKQEVKTTQKKKILEPAVKAVTFTVGAVAALAGMFWLFGLSFYGVRIYHRDGEEKCHYAGTCLVRRRGEDFELELPEMIAGQSGTGRFTLRPGRIFNRMNKGKELLIISGEQRESVWIGDEIPFQLSSCV